MCATYWSVLISGSVPMWQQLQHRRNPSSGPQCIRKSLDVLERAEFPFGVAMAVLSVAQNQTS